MNTESIGPLFDFADTKALNDAEKPRLSKQCAEILNLLRSSQLVSNQQMAGVALKYTSRLSDLRKSGYEVEVVSRSHETGLVWYSLRESA